MILKINLTFKHFTETEAEAARIQLWLKNNKCEDNDEVVQMWYETTNYRTRQLKKFNLSSDGEQLGEIFENWPSYRQAISNVLVSIILAIIEESFIKEI